MSSRSYQHTEALPHNKNNKSLTLQSQGAPFKCAPVRPVEAGRKPLPLLEPKQRDDRIGGSLDGRSKRGPVVESKGGGLQAPKPVNPNTIRPSLKPDKKSLKNPKSPKKIKSKIASNQLPKPKTVSLNPTAPQSNVYKSFIQATGGGDVTMNSREIVYRVIDYMDWHAQEKTAPRPVQIHYLQTHQSEYTPDNNFGLAGSLIKPKRVKVYGLPVANNNETHNGSYMAVCCVPTDHPTTGAIGNEFIAQQSKLVHPTFDQKWVKIVDIDYEKIFRDNDMGSLAFVDGSYVLYELALLNPDNGEAFGITGDETKKIQLKVVIDYAQPLPPATNYQGGITYAANFGMPTSRVNGSLLCQCQPMKLQDTM